jgi:hypothetical protein
LKGNRRPIELEGRLTFRLEERVKKLAPNQRKRFKYPPKIVRPIAVEQRRSWRVLALKALSGFWQKLKGSLISHPHIYIVSAAFLILFLWDYVNFITFISLGFFSVLLSDHLIENCKGYWKKYKSRSPERNPAEEEARQRKETSAAVLKISKRKGINR